MQEVLFAFIVVIGFIGFLNFRSPKTKGRIGESRVDSRLRSKLDAKHYITLTDIMLPYRDGTTQVDHIVVSIYGLFVIETKNMNGWIFGNANQARWTVVLYRHRFQFQNPLQQNYKHIKVIQELLGLEIGQLYNIVAFVGSAVPRTEMPENVLWNVCELDDYIKLEQAEIFTMAQINSFSDRLITSSIASNGQTRRDHKNYLKSQVKNRESYAIQCPFCNAKMVERSNRRSGQLFLGCSRYPQCLGSRKLP